MVFKYYQCVKCGKKYYPPKKRCRCGSTEFHEKTIENAIGEVVTHTTIYVPPKGFTPPIKMALANIDGMLILGRYEGTQDLYIGKKVRIELKDGKAIFTDL